MIVAATVCATMTPAHAGETYYKTPFSDQLYASDIAPGGEPSTCMARLVFPYEWQRAGTPAPILTKPTYHRLPYEPRITAISDFNDVDGCRVVEGLNYEQWAAVGHPAPTISPVDWYAYTTADEIFAFSDVPFQKHNHVSYAEWAASGHPAARQEDEGFVRYAWSPRIFHLYDTDTSPAATQLEPGLWQWLDYPTPLLLDGVGYFAKRADSDVITFHDGVVDFHVSYDEWAAAGYPAPVPD